MLKGIVGSFVFFAIFAYAQNSCIQSVFDKYQIAKGGFVFYQNNTYQTNNLKWVKQRYIPASTFKIFHSLIGLELGVVNPQELFFVYSGEKLEMKQWEKTMTLKEAIATSNVPSFKALAKKIGYTRMKENIRKLQYGNQDIGTIEDLQKFWLKGPLRISPIEQVDLLFALANKQLPFSEKSQDEVIEMLEQDKGAYKMYAKTGLSVASDGKYGWIVGWISSKDKNTDSVIPFALHLGWKEEMPYILRFQIVEDVFQKCVFHQK